MHELPQYYQWLSVPITADQPCGVSIDYHPDYLAIQQQLAPILAPEYGDFIAPVLPVRWETVEPVVKKLTYISKDLRLIIFLIRCRLPVIGIAALTEGLQTIISLLQQWPEMLYPQCHDEGEFVPEYRHNALMGLDDDEGILAAIRQLILQTNDSDRLSVSEIEQLISRNSPSTVPNEHIIEKVLRANLPFLEQCRSAQTALEQLCALPDSILGCGPLSCPKLEQLVNLFTRFHLQPQIAAEIAPQEPSRLHTQENSPSPPDLFADHLSYRALTLEQLRQMQNWFAFYEPSSPIPLILRFAEKSIGKDFQQLHQMYSSELIALLKINED